MFSIGQRVRYVKPHPSHNPKLKRFAGASGTVTSINENEACVDFSSGDYFIGSVFWIKYRYLEPVNPDLNMNLDSLTKP